METVVRNVSLSDFITQAEVLGIRIFKSMLTSEGFIKTYFEYDTSVEKCIRYQTITR